MTLRVNAGSLLPWSTRLSHPFSGALRAFSYWVANGTLGQAVLDGIDYSFVLSGDPSALERVYAIFANVIEMDDVGNVLNAGYAERRAAQRLRSYIEPAYNVAPPFEDWEVQLHNPRREKTQLPPSGMSGKPYWSPRTAHAGGLLAVSGCGCGFVARWTR